MEERFIALVQDAIREQGLKWVLRQVSRAAYRLAEKAEGKLTKFSNCQLPVTPHDDIVSLALVSGHLENIIRACYPNDQHPAPPG